MQIPVKIDVPLGTVLALSDELDIDNQSTLAELAALLHLAETAGPKLPEDALARAVFKAFEAHAFGDPDYMEELYPDLLKGTGPSPRIAADNRKASDEPMNVSLSIEISIEEIFDWGTWQYDRTELEDKLMDVTLHHLVKKDAAFVPVELLTAAIYQGFVWSRNGHEEDASRAFANHFVEPLRKLHREARRAREEWSREAA